MKRPIIRKTLPVLFVCTGLLSAQTLKIDECYELARQNYPAIKQYELIQKSLEYNLNNANKAYLPQLSLTGIGGYVFGGLPSLGAPGSSTSEQSNFHFIGLGQINQTLWDGGATKTQKDIAKASSDLEKSNVDVMMYGLRERINQLYFGLLLIDEQIKQLGIQQDLLQKNLGKASAYKENGLAYKTDVDELKAEVLRLDQRKIEFSFTRKGFVKMLSLMMNQSLDDEVKLEIPGDKQVSQSGLNRPELNLFKSQKNLADQQSQINRVSTMPKIGLLGAGVLMNPGVMIGTKELSSLALAGLSASWTIAGLYKIKNNSQIHKINIEKIGNQEEQFLFNTNLQLTQAKNDLDKKMAILAKDNEIVQLRTQIRTAYQLKYDNGLCPLNDLLSATDKEAEALSNQALHKTEYILSQYQYATTNGN